MNMKKLSRKEIKKVRGANAGHSNVGQRNTGQQRPRLGQKRARGISLSASQQARFNNLSPQLQGQLRANGMANPDGADASLRNGGVMAADSVMCVW